MSGVDDAMSSHPLLSGSSHLLQLLAAGSAGILLQWLSGHRRHLWEAFLDCTLFPTPIPFSKPCFFSLGWGDGTLDSFRSPGWRRRERCGPEMDLVSGLHLRAAWSYGKSHSGAFPTVCLILLRLLEGSLPFQS